MIERLPDPESVCVMETNYDLPGSESVYKGKVRDIYRLEDKLIMVVSDRISAFDYVLPRPIPYKGAVLNGIAAHFLNAVQDIVPIWLEAVPDPNVSIGKYCRPIKIEMVMRGYLAGHAWREYRAGKRLLCGQKMPDGMREGERFPQPLITPTTKASTGHDQDISPDEIIRQGIVDEEIYSQMEAYTHALFQRGSEMAEKSGLILVDTKYEYGLYENKVVLIDELHTPDSSRYYIADGYEKRRRENLPQMQLSKEFVREWLMANGFHGRKGEKIPSMDDSIIWEISDRYLELYEKLTGAFLKKEVLNKAPAERIMENIEHWLRTQRDNR